MNRRTESLRCGALLKVLRIAAAISAVMLCAFSAADAQKAAKKSVPAKKPAATAAAPDGIKIFATTCVVCHQLDGAGKEGLFPPLAGSEWVIGDEAKLLRIILHGLTGPVEVAGETFSGAMPGWGAILKDAEIAAVATYVRSAWGNKAAPITTAKAAAVRSATLSRQVPFTVADLAQVVTPVKKK